jgi:hypothetical protein
MTLPITLLDAAESEMAEAIAWYEEREAGLGTALRETLESTIAAIQHHRSHILLCRVRKFVEP